MSDRVRSRPPLVQGFLRRGGESEIDGTREVLLAAIVAPGRQQFLRAQCAEERTLFGTEQVLAALAARAREIAGTQFQPARAVSQHRVVLIVGMRADQQHAAEHVQLRQRVANGRRSDEKIFRPQRQYTERTQQANESDSGLTHGLC